MARRSHGTGLSAGWTETKDGKLRKREKATHRKRLEQALTEQPRQALNQVHTRDLTQWRVSLNLRVGLGLAVRTPSSVPTTLGQFPQWGHTQRWCWPRHACGSLPKLPSHGHPSRHPALARLLWAELELIGPCRPSPEATALGASDVWYCGP